MVPYLRHQGVMFYLLYFLVYYNSASIISHIYPILLSFLHTQLMAGVTTWNLNLLPGDESGFFVHYNIQSMLVRTIEH